ncbi:MAG: 2-octaprenyl-6-methoxyphenyl hydroxylase, partial [Steroidobacteraceae bacterium]|nr:2-octaprenyl-6-methoxyphenyl hydroxylase [Steroidobacteraceae bacterium]
APGDERQPSFDDRTTALGNATQTMLATIGVWPALESEAAAIRAIHVSEAGRFGVARLDAAEQGIDAFGYVVTNRSLGRALWAQLAQANDIVRLMPARAVWNGAGDDDARLSIEPVGRGGPPPQLLRARLVVGADGADSALRAALGFDAQTVDYRQVAVIANVATDRPHEGIAHERFTPSGPIALLPLAGDARGLVWALEPAHAERRLRAADEEFLRALQREFGWRAGRFERVGRRAAYPLALQRATSSAARRCVLIGNAAQALHPIAGQGFNLGMRDAALLAEIVLESRADCGAPAALERFEDARRADRAGVVRFTDGLVRLFADARPGMGLARSAGLLLFDLLPPAKAALARLSWGWDRATPKLTRGAKLR